MNIYQTDLQKEEAKQPTELDFYQAADRRHLLRTDEETYKLRRLIAGAAGEKTVADYLNQYGKSHWLGIPNLWMNYFGPFECDFLLITRYKIYVFEIKNYKGEFVYKDGFVKINNKQKTFNPIHQTRRNYRNVQEIISEINPNIQVEGATIFTGINNAVFMESEVSDIKIIPRSYLKWYIDQIIKEEQENRRLITNQEAILEKLTSYQIENSFLPEAISKEKMATAKRGIQCAKCHSFHIKVNRFNVECRCGYKEDREIATLRAIYDYAVLMFDKPLTRSSLLEFLDGQASKTYLVNNLNKHFPAINNSAKRSYVVENFSEFKEKINRLNSLN